MARVISQLITAPSNLNADYLNDYKSQTSFGGSALSALGSGLKGVSDAIVGYQDRKAVSDAKEKEEQDKYNRAMKVKAWESDPSLTDDDNEFKNTLAYKEAKERFIATGDASILNARNAFNTEKTLAAEKAARDAEKAAEADKKAEESKVEAEKEAREAGFWRLYNETSIDGLTDAEVKKMPYEERKRRLEELNNLFEKANAFGLQNLVDNVNKQRERLQSLYEKKKKEGGAADKKKQLALPEE